MWAFSFYGLIAIVRQSQSQCQKDAVKMFYLPLLWFMWRGKLKGQHATQQQNLNSNEKPWQTDRLNMTHWQNAKKLNAKLINESCVLIHLNTLHWKGNKGVWQVWERIWQQQKSTVKIFMVYSTFMALELSLSRR